MADALLDYAFKVALSVAPSLANAGYLRSALAIVKAKDGLGTIGNITFCQSVAEISALTDDAMVAEFLKNGQGINLLPVDELADAADAVSEYTDGFTVLFGSDWTDAEIASFNRGNFPGVLAGNFETQANAKTYSATDRQSGYNGHDGNFFFLWGAYLANTTWKNMQYLQLPYSDGVTTTVMADSKFNDRVSFGLDSAQYGTRLAFFGAGGQAITAPYIIEEIIINLQSEWLRYAAVNNPAYTIVGAKLFEQNAQTRVLDSYIADGLIAFGTIGITLVQDDFVGDASVRMQRPRAWWRIFASVQAE